MTMSRWHGSVVCLALLLIRLAGSAVAQSQPDSAVAPSSPSDSLAANRTPRSLSAQDQVLANAISSHRYGQVVQHITRGKRLFDKHQYAQSARDFAVAYTFEARPEVLLEVARACRKAEMEDVALAIFSRLQEEAPQSPYHTEIEQELRSLAYIQEDSEISGTQVLWHRMNAARQEFQAGHFQGAVLEYALAYSVKPLPRLVFNAAQAYRRSGQAEAAYILYARFLEEEPESPVRKETLGYMKELHAAAFPPPLFRRAVLWIPLASIAIAGVALGVGLGYGLQSPLLKTPPVIKFSFP